MRHIFFIPLLLPLLLAFEPRVSTARVSTDEVQASIQKQRASVLKQVGGVAPADGFFTTPWLATRTPAAAQAPSPLLSSSDGDCEPLNQATLGNLISEASREAGVSSKLLRAIVRRESAGKPCAVSGKGAQGLMQLMPATQVDLGVKDPFDPSANITAGARYLKQMLDRYKGNVALALAAYNAGPQRVEPGGKVPDIPETQAYVMRILAGMNEEPEPEVK